MKNFEIVKLGKSLGLSFSETTQFPDQYNKHMVVFDGCNGQRFLVDGSWTDKEIYKTLGRSLVLQGRREMKLELHRLISPMSD